MGGASVLFALTQALERYDCLSGRIEQAEQRILATMTMLAPEPEEPTAVPTGRDAALVDASRAVMGVDLTAFPTIGVETALVLACEIGPDLSRFPTPEPFCSWLTLAPGPRISAGKSLKGAPAKRTNRAGQALRMAAGTARHNRTFIGACHRARLRRLDTARAIKATAHQLARIIDAMLTRGEDDVERGIEHFERERRDRQLRHLHRQARHFNLALAPAEAA